ncbi:MAG TPA: type II toxin-antitoxin system RelE/ParE family toxin [Candidatus Nanoarchaeia archaeon]|nr:type II toxin-antitoxin system RelE/ParE family toxin [Candidatus Nanoarchaeia archaeon]
MYSVELSQKADKFLKKLDNELSERIRERLKMLGNNPIPSDSKFITRDGNEKVFRIRIGDYRALYKIKDAQSIVLVAKIDKRPSVYKRGF